MTAKTRDAEATRATILATARAQFGSNGFECTTIRSIASEAGVDPALVMHYFGNKAQLFAEASRLEIDFPDLAGVSADRLADVLVPLVVDVWRPDGPFLPLLRAAATHPAARDALLKVFVEQVTPALTALASDHPAERAVMVGSQVLGIALARYILQEPTLVEMDDAVLADWVRPALAHYLTGPMPGRGTADAR
ncbi:TetR/AcrR family transcriptional regulator [Mycolicibacterium palauense]|uniref:TetR/AcrR family transcriptional regulator n=1 Tax=Mycolicibacterium palauense TaxID=2034511 RepID=UPI000BFEB32B|nr:TetR family transcriptional regulator [Mycolicibacterium palauense]